MKEKINNKSRQASPADNEKRETVLTVPDDTEQTDREQKEKSVVEKAAQPDAAPPPARGSVPVSNR